VARANPSPPFSSSRGRLLRTEAIDNKIAMVVHCLFIYIFKSGRRPVWLRCCSPQVRRQRGRLVLRKRHRPACSRASIHPFYHWASQRSIPRPPYRRGNGRGRCQPLEEKGLCGEGVRHGATPPGHFPFWAKGDLWRVTSAQGHFRYGFLLPDDPQGNGSSRVRGITSQNHLLPLLARRPAIETRDTWVPRGHW